MADKNLMHYVTVTGILVKDGKFLIVKRADWEKAFPGKWTVPGGKIEVLDYALRKKDTSDHWYNVVEDALKKEVLEEVGIAVNDVGYVTNLVYIRSDNIPCMIISLYANVDTLTNRSDHCQKGTSSENVRLCNALTEYKWVTLEEAKQYDLIEGIYGELEILDKMLRRSAYPKSQNEGAKTGNVEAWSRKMEGF